MMRLPLLVTFLFAGSSIASAHPYHATLAEMEWNPETRVFEVSLQFAGIEVDEVLSRLHGRQINLETAPEAETLLQDYVKKHFRISDAAHASCRIRWVGIEIQIRNVWAYFEIELIEADAQKQNPKLEAPPEFSDLAVHCSLLMASNPLHVNLVNLTTPTKTGSLHLTSQHPDGIIELSPRPAVRRPINARHRN